MVKGGSQKKKQVVKGVNLHREESDSKKEYPKKFGKPAVSKPTAKPIVKEVDPDLSKSRNRKNQKMELKSKRKGSFDVIARVNKLYSKLLLEGREVSTKMIRKGNQSTESTVKTVAEILDALKDTFSLYVDHRSVSRVIQAVLKYGSDIQRKQTMEKLFPIFPRLCQQLHASRVACKILDLADRSQVVQILDAIVDDKKTATEIFFHKYGQVVWEKITSLAIPPTMVRKYLYKIIIPKIIWLTKKSELEKLPYEKLWETLEEEEKKTVQENFSTLVDKMFDKKLLFPSTMHLVLKYFLMNANETQINDVLSKIDDSDSHSMLLSTRDGGECLVTLLGYATPKQKKKYAKVLKEAIFDVSANRYVNVVLLRFLLTTDDTKLIKESVLAPLLNSGRLLDIVCNKVARRFLLAVLNPTSKAYIPLDDRNLLALPSPTSKKDAEKRRSELLGDVLKALIDLFVSNSETVNDIEMGSAKENEQDEEMDMDEEDMEEEQEAKEDMSLQTESERPTNIVEWLINENSRDVLLETILASMNEELLNMLSEAFAKIFADESNLSNIHVQKFVSFLLRSKFEDITANHMYLYEKLWNALKKHSVATLLDSKCIFLIVDILRANNKSLNNDIRKVITKTECEKFKKSNPENKGLELLEASLSQ